MTVASGCRHSTMRPWAPHGGKSVPSRKYPHTITLSSLESSVYNTRAREQSLLQVARLILLVFEHSEAAQKALSDTRRTRTRVLS